VELLILNQTFPKDFRKFGIDFRQKMRGVDGQQATHKNLKGRAF